MARWRLALAGLVCTAGLASAVAGEAVEADGTTALHRAIYAGDVAAARHLIDSGADPRAANLFGATPMMLAASRGEAAVIRVLLDAGVNPDSPNAEGQTALMAVARTGNLDAARLLLQKGANVHAREEWGGQTALMWAAAQSQPAMIRLLLERGARVDERSTVRDWQRRVTAEGRPKDMVRGGLTPLLFAAREGCIDCLKALLDKGADIDLTDPDGSSALVLALLNRNWDAAKFLIEAGADVNLWDVYGQAPLYVAVDMNTLPVGRRIELPTMDRTTGEDIVRLLLEKGANPNMQLKLRPRYRNIPNDRYRDPMIVWGTTPLLRAAKAGDVPLLKLLLQHGALANLPNSQGVTPLMAAAGDGHVHDPTRGRLRTEADAHGAQHRRCRSQGSDGRRPHRAACGRVPGMERTGAPAGGRWGRARCDRFEWPLADRLRAGSLPERVQRAAAGELSGDGSAAAFLRCQG